MRDRAAQALREREEVEQKTFTTIEEALAYVEEDGHIFTKWSFFLDAREETPVYPGLDGWGSVCTCERCAGEAEPLIAIVSYGPDGQRYFTIDMRNGPCTWDMPWPPPREEQGILRRALR